MEEEQIQQDLMEETVQVRLLPERFQRLAVLGQGGMGIVFRAHDTLLDRTVAVKVLSFDGSRSDEMQKRFLQEAKALASLEHANIVKILGSGVSENRDLYHVLEFLDGHSLSVELNNSGGRGLSSIRFFEIMTQVCRGLAHAHDKRVVHRDLKPSNIYLCQDGSGKEFVKIIDFGIARLLLDGKARDSLALTRTNLSLGSPAYMSPEQCRGERVDYQSDIYSLGCLMYECLRGHPPFRAENSMEIMYKHMQEEAPKLEAVACSAAAKRLACLIDNCLKKNPQDRPAGIEHILNELVEISQTHPELNEFKSGGNSAKKGIGLSTWLMLFLLAAITGASFFLFKPSSKVEARKAGTPQQRLQLDSLFKKLQGLKNQEKLAANDATRFQLRKQLSATALQAAELQVSMRTLKDAALTVQDAMDYVPACNSGEKALRAMLLYELGKIRYLQSREEESHQNYDESVKLISEAPYIAEFDKKLEAILLSVIESRENKYEFELARRDFLVLKKLWNSRSIKPASTAEDDTLRKCKVLIGSTVRGGILLDHPEWRIPACYFTIEVCDYEVSRGDYESTASPLRQCVHSLVDMSQDIPRNDKNFEIMLKRARKLLSEIDEQKIPESDPKAGLFQRLKD